MSYPSFFSTQTRSNDALLGLTSSKNQPLSKCRVLGWIWITSLTVILHMPTALASSFLPMDGTGLTQEVKNLLEQGKVLTLRSGEEVIRVDDMVFRHSELSLRGFIGTPWTSGIVYYDFDSSINTTKRQQFADAAKKWEDVASLTFVPCGGSVCSDGNYIHVIEDDGNWSYVGMQEGGQDLSIVNWDSTYIIVHEIGHALGLEHEHSRSDRDCYIQVVDENIIPGEESNFELRLTENYTEYDFLSIMHYQACAFSIHDPCDPHNASQVTIWPQPGYEDKIDDMGNREYLTDEDKQGMVGRYPICEGENWVVQNSSQHNFRSVVWNGTMFVAVGDDGSIRREATIASSADGVSWTTIGIPVLGCDDCHFSAVTWNGSVFVAVGQGNNYSSIYTLGFIVTSVDGVVWSEPVITDPWLGDVEWNGSIFVAVGERATIMKSLDGLSWVTVQEKDNNYEGGSLNGVVWTGSFFAALGESGGVFLSDDGSTWKEGEIFNYSSCTVDTVDPLCWAELMDIASNGSRLVVVGGDNATVITSDDGLSWNTHLLGDSGFLEGVIWTGSQFIAVGSVPGAVFFSPDGIVWSRQSLPIYPRSIAVGNNTLVAVAVGNEGNIATSHCPAPDLINNESCGIPQQLYLQNENITTIETYLALNSINAGRNVTTQIPQGDFVIESGGDVDFKAGNIIELEQGFRVMEGGSFKATIE